jgi:hypothetical protein
MLFLPDRASPGSRREIAQARMGTSVVVVVDPRTNDADHVVEIHEAVLSDAFALEGFVVGFDHAVLLRRVRMDELLSQTVRREQPAIEP